MQQQKKAQYQPEDLIQTDQLQIDYLWIITFLSAQVFLLFECLNFYIYTCSFYIFQLLIYQARSYRKQRIHTLS